MKSMVRTLPVLLFLTSSLFAQSSKDVPSVPDQKACAALVDGVDSSLSIQSAEFVQPPFSTFARGTSGPQITVNVPFCRVAGMIPLRAVVAATGGLEFEITGEKLVTIRVADLPR